MPNTILLKRSSTAAAQPAAGNLAAGELAINTADGRLFAKNSANAVVNLPVSSIAGQAITPSSVQTSGTADGIKIQAGGAANSRVITLQPTALGGNRTLTLPDATAELAMTFNPLAVTGTSPFANQKRGTIRNNFDDPTTEEAALFHGQFYNQLRFLSPALQEESADGGTTWTTSTRMSVDALGNMMRGEGEGTSVSIIPSGSATPLGYRLTWDNTVTGNVYWTFSHLYINCSTNGNLTTFKIEAFHNTNGWTEIFTGTANNYPGHVSIKHTVIPYYPTNAGAYGKLRVTFTASTPTTPITMYAMEWFGGYPNGKRNAESYDRSKNVTFPAAINTPTGYRISNGATAGQYLRGNGTQFVASTIQSSDLGSGTANNTAYLSGDRTWQTLSKTAVGLGNVDNLSASSLFNNNGDGHATRAAFGTTPSYGFGFRYIMGATNGPGVNSASQYYSLYTGLGSDYPATGAGSYGVQLAIPRNVTTPYFAVRYNESNSWGGWQKISAGYADSAGAAPWSGITSKPTTFAGFGLNGAYSQSNPVFGQQGIKQSIADNVLYSAADRFEFYIDNVLQSSNTLFNLAYDQSGVTLLPNATKVFRLVFNTKGNSTTGITHPEGNVYLSFYYFSGPGSVSGRVKDKDGVWRNITNWTNVAINGFAVWRGTVANNVYVVEMELTVVAGSTATVGADATWFNQIEYVMDRPGQFELGVINKAQDNNLWRNLNFKNSSSTTTLSITPAGNLTTSGNIGAGTTSPASRLHANDDTVLSAAGTQLNTFLLSAGGGSGIGARHGIQFRANGGADDTRVCGIYQVVENTSANSTGLVFHTSSWTGAGTFNVERLRINNAGNVGIGTTTPANSLHVVGTPNTSTGHGVIVVANSSTSATRVTHIGLPNDSHPFLAALNGTTTAATFGWGFFDSSATGHLEIKRRNGSTTWVDALAVDRTNGNVGVGNAAPGSRLVVKGAGATSATSALNVTNSADTSLLAVRNDGLTTVTGQISSTLAVGTAPLAVTSTTVCTNLNADTIDGQHASAFAAAAHTHGNITSDGKVGAVSGRVLVTTTAGAVTAADVINGSLVSLIANSGVADLGPDTMSASFLQYVYDSNNAQARSVIGAAAATHTHGSITNDGKVGSTPNLPLITGSGGVVSAGAFGTAANTFCQGDDSRLSNSRAPSGSAGGDLTGTYPNPTLTASGATAGTYKSVTVDTKGRVTAGTNPTTLAGYGITDAYTSAQVDALLQGLDVKASVKAASTGQLVLFGTQTVDAVPLVAGDRVLVKNQTTALQNGIYSVAAGAWARAGDFDAWTEIPGAFTFVEQGTTNADSGWVCISEVGGTLNSTAIAFSQFSGAGQITAGSGLSKSGNTLSTNLQAANLPAPQRLSSYCSGLFFG